MDYLVDCPCGHALGRHQAGGCTSHRCGCPLDRAAALDAAVDEAARSEWARVEAIPRLADRDVLPHTRISRLATMDEIVGAVGVPGEERCRGRASAGPSGIFWQCGCVASHAPAADMYVWLRCERHRTALGQ